MCYVAYLWAIIDLTNKTKALNCFLSDNYY